jgi:hypothetical protein
MKQIELFSGDVAVVDDEDWDRLRDLKWFVIRDLATNYAYTRINRKAVKLHRLIMGVTDPKIQVDHLDGDGLNNRKENLRIATGHQNQGNRRKLKPASSRFKGVCFNKRTKKWKAQIKRHGKKVHLGTFSDEIAAAQAYDIAAIEYFGAFANLNLPVVKAAA